MPKFSKAPATKPAKPHKDYPLTPHPGGKWCKKVKGKIYYFGPWDDPQGALDNWLATKDAILLAARPVGQQSRCQQTRLVQ